MTDIRSVGTEDISELIRLNRVVQQLHASHSPEIFKPHPDEAELREFFSDLLTDESNTLLLASIGEEAAGYIWARIAEKQASPFTHARRIMYIQQLAVKPEIHGRGIASELVSAVEEIARKAGIKQVQLDYWAFNHGAEAFFRKRGYTPFNLLAWKTL